MRYKESAKNQALDELKRHGPALTHRRIAELAGANSRVLELGCATGYVSELMKKNGCRVIGVEIDDDAAKEAGKYCDEMIIGDAADPDVLNRAGKDFDVVLCGDILEHLPDPESVLVHIKRLLNSNGIVLVSMPNIAYWRMRWDLLCGKFEYQDFGLLDRTHLRFYTVHSFFELAKITGYKIDKTIVNDAGFPASDFLKKIPFLRSTVSRISYKLAKMHPNLFSFHSIYKLIPVSKSNPGA